MHQNTLDCWIACDILGLLFFTARKKVPKSTFDISHRGVRCVLEQIKDEGEIKARI